MIENAILKIPQYIPGKAVKLSFDGAVTCSPLLGKLCDQLKW